MIDAGVLQFFTARGAGLDAAHMDPDFAQSLMNAVKAAEMATGQQANFTSFARTPETQAQLYANYTQQPVQWGGKTYRPTVGPGQQGLAAPPGQSRHNFGAAADLADGPILDWLHNNAGTYGLSFLSGNSFTNDPGHIQLKGPPPSGTMAYTGSGSPTAGQGAIDAATGQGGSLSSATASQRLFMPRSEAIAARQAGGTPRLDELSHIVQERRMGNRPLLQALQNFVQTRRADTSTATPPVSVGGGGGSRSSGGGGGGATPDPAVEQLQRELRAAGFDPGPVDGLMGPQTRAAMAARDAQAARSTGNPVTGTMLAAAAGTPKPGAAFSAAGLGVTGPQGVRSPYSMPPKATYIDQAPPQRPELPIAPGPTPPQPGRWAGPEIDPNNGAPYGYVPPGWLPIPPDPHEGMPRFGTPSTVPSTGGVLPSAQDGANRAAQGINIGGILGNMPQFQMPQQAGVITPSFPTDLSTVPMNQLARLGTGATPEQVQAIYAEIDRRRQMAEIQGQQAQPGILAGQGDMRRLGGGNPRIAPPAPPVNASIGEGQYMPQEQQALMALGGNRSQFPQANTQMMPSGPHPTQNDMLIQMLLAGQGGPGRLPLQHIIQQLRAGR